MTEDVPHAAARSGADEAQVRATLAAFSATRRMAGAELEPLAGGVAQRAWKVVLGEERWFLRVATYDTESLGADPASEARLLQLAGNAGIAPRLVFHAPEAGLLVTEYVAGRTWGEADLADPARLRRLGAQLERLHALPADPAIRCVDFAVQARMLEGRLTAAGLQLPDEMRMQAWAAFARLGSIERPVVLCHNDVTAHNLIEDAAGQVWLVDWEYGGRGDPLYDLVPALRRRSERAIVAPMTTLEAASGSFGLTQVLLADIVLTYDYVQWLWYRAWDSAR